MLLEFLPPPTSALQKSFSILANMGFLYLSYVFQRAKQSPGRLSSVAWKLDDLTRDVKEDEKP